MLEFSLCVFVSVGTTNSVSAAYSAGDLPAARRACAVSQVDYPTPLLSYRMSMAVSIGNFSSAMSEPIIIINLRAENSRQRPVVLILTIT